MKLEGNNHPFVGSGGHLNPDLERLLLEAHQNEYLTLLDISIPLFNDQGQRFLLNQHMAECILKLLQQTPRFCKLQMDVAWQTQGAVCVLGRFLRSTRQISSLSLKQQQQHPHQQPEECNRPVPFWFETLADDLEANESIQEFTVSHFDLERNGAIQSLLARWNFKGKTLKLQECRFGSNANFLRLRPQLQDLSLFRCHFAEDAVGARIVSTVAKSCPKLKRLNLCWNTGLEGKTLCSLTRLLQSPSTRISSLSLNANKGLLEDATLEESFYHTLCYANDSLLDLCICNTGNEDKENGAARVFQLQTCRLRNRVDARVRHTLDTTTMHTNLSLWGPALGRLARPDSKTGSCFVGVSGLFLAISTLSPKLSEQAASKTRSAP